MKLGKPFKKFRCDICGREVKPEEGMLLWNTEFDEEGNHFLTDCAIVHNTTRCDGGQDMSCNLDYCVDNPAFWLERMRLYGGQTKAEMDGTWLTCMARCLVPYFEEAMPYIKDYERDGYEFKLTKNDPKYVLRWHHDEIQRTQDND